MRKTLLTLIVAAAPLAAQAQPEGWTIRLDAKDSTAKAADTKFQTMGQGFHVTSGPAAIYYNAKDQASGAYTVRATFGQRVAPMHPEAYGVFVGGSMLVDNAKQQYLYLLVRGNGQYYVAHRAGNDVHPIVPWTNSDAVKKQNENGAAQNEVGIRVTADSVVMMVNGAAVRGFSKKDMHGFNTDGQYGLRVNHGLNVHIANFGLQK